MLLCSENDTTWIKKRKRVLKLHILTRPVLVYQEELLSARQTQYYTRHTTWSVLSVFFICLHNKDCNQCLFFLLPPQYFLTPLCVSFWWKLCWSLYFSITITLQCLFVLWVLKQIITLLGVSVFKYKWALEHSWATTATRESNILKQFKRNNITFQPKKIKRHS